MARRAGILLGLLSSFWGCSAARPTSPEVYQQDHRVVGLGPGDVFDVRVFGEEGLSAQYRVESDGTIDFPFLGRISVVGEDSRGIAALISSGLRDRAILINPQVTVFISESNSLRVSVMGAVARPGTFPVVPGMTVVQAISSAGGFTALASQNDTVLTRRSDDGGVRRFSVPVRRISDGREADVPVRGGDIVFVPERTF